MFDCLQEAGRGLLFPRFQSIQEVSMRLTCEIATTMVGAEGGGQIPEDLAGQSSPDWEAYVASKMYQNVPVSKL